MTGDTTLLLDRLHGFKRGTFIQIEDLHMRFLFREGQRNGPSDALP